MSENFHSTIGGQVHSGIFYAPETRKGELLLRLLPFGVCSTQGLAMLGHESRVLYKFVESGYIRKEERTISRKGRFKKETFCYLTPKGMRRICTDDYSKPAWVENIDYEFPSFQICPTLKTHEILTLSNIQDAIIFFSYSGVPNLLTALLQQKPEAVFVLLYLASRLTTMEHNSVLEKTAEAVYFLSTENKSEDDFGLQDLLTDHAEAGKDISKSETSDSVFRQAAEHYFQCDHIEKPQERFLSFREAYARLELSKEVLPNKIMRDTSIGIYSGEGQSVPVYMTNRNGISYYRYFQTRSQDIRSKCETFASENPQRQTADNCQNAIILCRTQSEFVRAVIDPSNLRKQDKDKTFGPQYKHIFMVPMNAHGMRIVRFFAEKSSEKYKQLHRSDRVRVAKLLGNICMQNGVLYDEKNHCNAYLLFELDTSEIYPAMEEAERSNNLVTVIIQKWQAGWFDQLQENWKYHRLFSENAKHYGFRYLFIISEDKDNPYDTPMPNSE